MEITPNKKLKVGIVPSLPFSVESNDNYSGFEVELWEEIAKELGLAYEYQKFNFQDIIQSVIDGKVDVAFSAITISEKREEVVDFSYPTFNSGLRILLSKSRGKINVKNTIKEFIAQGYKQLLKPIIGLLLLAVLFGNLFWYFEKSGGIISPEYITGVLQSVWVALCTILGSDGGLYVYEITTWAGRFILTLGQLVNLAALGLLIGELTAFITTKKIRLNIETKQDLKGKIVATVAQTTSELVLKDVGAHVISVTKIEDAYKKLNNNEVEAVVFDSPVLVYYANNEGADWAEVVGEVFDKQDYGIMIAEDNDLRKDINVALLGLHESGYYDSLYKKWFGEVE